MKKLALCLLALLALTLPALAHGGQPADRQLIRLQTTTFDPIVDGEPTLAVAADAQASVAAGPYYIVQFKGPVEEVWARQLERLGATLLDYIPDNAHIARIQPADVAKVRSMYAVRWVGPYRPAYKLSPAFKRASALASGHTDAVYIVAFAGESLEQLTEALRRQGAQVDDAAEMAIGAVVQARVPDAALLQIAANPAVSWVEPFVPLKLDNSEARKIINVENVWERQGLFGAGQIVAVSDSGLSVQGDLNADFGAARLRRAFAPSEMNLTSPACNAKANWTDINGHGTHVAGSILGNGSNSGSNPANHDYATSYAGMAPEAQLVFMAMNTDGSGSLQCIPLNGGFVAKGYEEGARISSNSWGGGLGAYSALSSIVDNYIWNHKDYTVLYSAGNSGANGAATIGAPGTAKNVITVGASENNRPSLGAISDNPNQVAYFSSRGPTADGRIKPDVVAPGTRIISVRAAQAQPSFEPTAPGARYAYSDGTSMATPITAGATALAREWLGEQRGMTDPSAAFMKALMIHGAFRLPGAAIPNNDSGWGRVDLKNTLGARYAIFDDHLQGLSTGDTVNYTLQVGGSNSSGTLFVNGQDAPVAPSDLTLASTQPTTTTQTENQSTFRVTAVPGFDKLNSNNSTPIQATGSAAKAGLAVLQGRQALARSQLTQGGQLTQVNGAPAIDSYLYNVVGGGDFEEPAWSNTWSQVWLGSGRPIVTRNPQYVLSGQQSLWLGGSNTDDSLWYPVSFPDAIDATQPSELTFLFQMRDLDLGYDMFCVAITDESGEIIAGLQDCYRGPADGINPGVTYQYTRTFTSTEKSRLQGKAGYVVLYTQGDHLIPHMSTFVDDVRLAVDYRTPTLGSTPSIGPAGTTFLLEGSNNLPYSPVAICPNPCNGSNAYETVYADAKGDVQAYLESTPDTAAGQYQVQSRDIAGRTARTTLTIHSSSPPQLTVGPTSGPAGTKFSFTGTDVVPGDSHIAVIVNGTFLGVVGSDMSGSVVFAIQTTSNTPAATYNLLIVDSAGRSASTAYQVTAAPTGSPTMTVTPTSGPAGSSFTFHGTNFAPNPKVTFTLDDQPIGEGTAEANGTFDVTLSTAATIAPGTYTLVAAQANRRASARFQITGGGSGPSGGGIYVTLVWTDPPAQANAASALINNLDLRVDGPGGPYFGNGGNGPDTKNNVEGIRLEQPAAGTYTVSVRAAAVDATFGSQPFALIATTAQNFGANSANAGFSRRIFLPVMRR